MDWEPETKRSRDDAIDPPLESHVPRIDRCCLKQKVGYSRDTAPQKQTRRNRSCVTRCPAQYPPLFSREDFLSGSDKWANIAVQGRVWALTIEQDNVKSRTVPERF
jgi:hypothetical protein